MKIVSFVEGAYERAGGLGLVGLPPLCKSVADRGHDVTLVIGGKPIQEDPRHVEARTGTDSLGKPPTESKLKVLSFPAYGKWAFSPLLPFEVMRLAADSDFITLHSLYSFPVLCGYFLAKIHNKPYGVWPHGVFAPFQRSVSATKKTVYGSLLAGRILDNASVMFYTAEGEKQEAADMQLKGPSVVVPHGVNARDYADLPEHGQFRDSLMNGHRGPLVLYLGRLNAKKGLDILVEAFASVSERRPDAKLAIVGSSDPPRFEAQIRSWIEAHQMADKIVLTGRLSFEQKRQALADSDIFVLPSHAENFSFAMFEALASRVPVVVSDSLNLAFQVRSYSAGLVRPRLSAAFAEAILELLSNDSLRKEMGNRGRKLAEAYSWESCGLKIERTIECVLAGEPLPKDLCQDLGA